MIRVKFPTSRGPFRCIFRWDRVHCTGTLVLVVVSVLMTVPATGQAPPQPQAELSPIRIDPNSIGLSEVTAPAINSRVQPPVAPDPAADGTIPALPSAAFAGQADADPSRSVLLDNADTLEEDAPGQWVARGHVKLHFHNYNLTSDRVDIDMDKGTALFTGHPILTIPQGTTVDSGNDGSLLLDFKHEMYRVIGARAVVPPNETSIGLLLPLYVSGGEITGRSGLIDARGSSFTTCDFVEPHYYFQARSMTIIPGRRLVARHVTLYRRGRPIFTIPTLYVPLDQRTARQTLTPDVGMSPDEGYFIKFAIGYELNSALPGILRLDAMQYKGIGTGFEQSFGAPNQPTKPLGTLNVYNLVDNSTSEDNLTGTLTDQQKLGQVKMMLNSQYQQNSYYIGEHTQSANTQLNLDRNVGNQDIALDTTLSQSNFGEGASNTITSALIDNFSPTKYEHLTTELNLNSFSAPGAGGASDHSELDSSVDYTQKGRVVDFEFLASKDTSLTSSVIGNQFYGGVERLPEIRLATDARRLKSLRQFLPVTSKASLSLGDFNEPTQQVHAERLWFDLDTGTSTKRISAGNTLNYSGIFEQGLYSDSAAEYVLNGRTTYTLKIGRRSAVTLDYDYLRPYGFSPFLFDTVGSTNLGTAAVSLLDNRRFTMQLGTGYDINRARSENGLPPLPWQNLSLQSQYAPNRHFLLSTSGSYDLNAEQLLQLSNTLHYHINSGISFDVASQYAAQQHRFATINSQLDLPFILDKREGSGWRMQAIEGYNGFSNSFSYKGLAVTRTWHDWEASVIYQDDPLGVRPGSSITFNFRLKAFPAYQPFGTGQFGQSFSPGVGQFY